MIDKKFTRIAASALAVLMCASSTGITGLVTPFSLTAGAYMATASMSKDSSYFTQQTDEELITNYGKEVFDAFDAARAPYKQWGTISLSKGVSGQVAISYLFEYNDFTSTKTYTDFVVLIHDLEPVFDAVEGLPRLYSCMYAFDNEEAFDNSEVFNSDRRNYSDYKRDWMIETYGDALYGDMSTSFDDDTPVAIHDRRFQFMATDSVEIAHGDEYFGDMDEYVSIRYNEYALDTSYMKFNLEWYDFFAEKEDGSTKSASELMSTLRAIPKDIAMAHYSEATPAHTYSTKGSLSEINLYVKIADIPDFSYEAFKQWGTAIEKGDFSQEFPFTIDATAIMSEDDFDAWKETVDSESLQTRFELDNGLTMGLRIEEDKAADIGILNGITLSEDDKYVSITFNDKSKDSPAYVYVWFDDDSLYSTDPADAWYNSFYDWNPIALPSVPLEKWDNRYRMSLELFNMDLVGEPTYEDLQDWAWSLYNKGAAVTAADLTFPYDVDFTKSDAIAAELSAMTPKGEATEVIDGVYFYEDDIVAATLGSDIPVYRLPAKFTTEKAYNDFRLMNRDGSYCGYLSNYNAISEYSADAVYYYDLVNLNSPALMIGYDASNGSAIIGSTTYFYVSDPIIVELPSLLQEFSAVTTVTEAATPVETTTAQVTMTTTSVSESYMPVETTVAQTTTDIVVVPESDVTTVSDIIVIGAETTTAETIPVTSESKWKDSPKTVETDIDGLVALFSVLATITVGAAGTIVLIKKHK